ncbi:MAG: transketolase [Myxococcota bacterium]|nr:transketolase [Myxococcales bacterium]
MGAEIDPTTARSRRRRPDAPFGELRREARLRLLRMHHRAGVGHIGGNLSALDALLVLHHRAMRDDDVFVLAKGHAAGALYVALWSIGELGDEDLDAFHGDGSILSGHPAPNALAGVPVATGSLGHGLPVAAGIALARKLERAPGRVFCLCSDGEWQEGSNWEALVFAHRHALDALVVLVDANGLQGFGTTEEVGGIDDLPARLRAFGFAVDECDGHDPEAIEARIAREAPGPRAIVLHTVKGKGVSFMEDRLEWHYLPLDDALYERARREVEGA